MGLEPATAETFVRDLTIDEMVRSRKGDLMKYVNEPSNESVDYNNYIAYHIIFNLLKDCVTTSGSKKMGCSVDSGCMCVMVCSTAGSVTALTVTTDTELHTTVFYPVRAILHRCVAVNGRSTSIQVQLRA